MKKFSNLGVALSIQQMKHVGGGYHYGAKPMPDYMVSKLLGPSKGEINCWALADTMRNTQYVIGPDGSDPYQELWKKEGCEEKISIP